jgi:hypothetical protein
VIVGVSLPSSATETQHHLRNEHHLPILRLLVSGHRNRVESSVVLDGRIENHSTIIHPSFVVLDSVISTEPNALDARSILVPFRRRGERLPPPFAQAAHPAVIERS